MQSLVRRAALDLSIKIAPHIPLGVYKALLPRAPYGFFYHAVSDSPLPHVRHLYPFKTAGEFELDLIWLQQNTTLLDYKALEEHFSDRRPLPSNAAFISFDDGFRECYDIVRPLLLKHGIPCIFFLTTDWIDNQALFFRSKISLALDALFSLSRNGQIEALHQFSGRFGSPLDPGDFAQWLKAHKEAETEAVDAVCSALGIQAAIFLKETHPYLSRAQIHEMQADGFTFGAHSCNHTKFMRLDPEAQSAQITRSCRSVSEITGADTVPFAFPFSGEGVSRSMLRRLKQDHPEIGLVFDTKKLLREQGVIHRIWADRPSPTVPPAQNLAHWLHDAYVHLVTRGEAGLD